jgi:hypothetical protein
MRKFWVIGLVCAIVSCGFFDSKDKKARELVKQEMRNIDWNQVDNYPLFEACDETLTKQDQKICFENELTSHLAATLDEFEYILDADINPTVYVDFVIDGEGKISVLDIEKDTKIDLQMPEFDGIIIQSLKGLPEISPALKRGIPVRAKFRIPIVLGSKQ